jgi:CheY-like chemotaxis protein
MENAENSILIVDDNAALQMNLRGFLADEGLRVFQASNVKEALEQCRRHKPRVVLLDIYLPGDLGTVFSVKVHENPGVYGSPWIIAMSGVVGEQMVEEGDFKETNHIHGFMKKPFDLKDLISGIRRYLEKSKASGSE